MGILIDSCHPKLKRPKTRGRAGEHRTKGSSGAFDFRPQERQGGNMGYQERLGAGQGEVDFAYAAPYLGTWGVVSNPAWANDIWWENCACIKCDSAE